MRSPSIIWVEKTGSSSDDLKKNISSLESGTVLAAVEQSCGRGQSDHKWHSAPGENLTFSIFVSYDEAHSLSAHNQQILTMASSVAVTDFLSENNIVAQIKKPNDIYVSGRKICGMLIENSLRGDAMNWSIIGIGINVNQCDFPSDIPNPVSMCQLTGRHFDIEKCLSDFLRHFSNRFDAIWTDPQAVISVYEERSCSISLPGSSALKTEVPQTSISAPASDNATAF